MNPFVKAWRAADAFVARGFKSLLFGRTTGSPTWAYHWSNRTRYDYAGAVGDGTNNSAVMNCLAWITGAFPQAPLIVEQRKGTEWEPVPDHPIERLFMHPNPFSTRAVLWSALLTAYHTDGNAYLLKERSREGVPIALWFESPENMEPVSEDPRVFIQYYRRTVGGEQEKWRPEDVIRIPNGVDPQNNRLGRAPLKAALREVFADDEAALMFGSLMRNMGIPGVLISPDSEQAQLDQGDAELIKADFEAKFGGDNRGRPMVLPSRAKVERLAFSPEQMDLRELRRLPEERVSGALRLPAIVAQLGAGLDRSTFANYAEAREAAWEDNILPTMAAFAEAITLSLMPDFSDPNRFRVGFDISEIRVLQADENALTDRMVKQLQAGAITVAEFRRGIGMDADTSHKFYLIPSGYEVRAQLEAPEPEPVEEPPGPGNDANPFPALEPPTDDDITALLAEGRRE